MIEIVHTDYSSSYDGGILLEGDSINKIYQYDNSLWVTCKTAEYDDVTYQCAITFNITKLFIQELKALVMVMENTFEEIDDDSRD